MDSKMTTQQPATASEDTVPNPYDELDAVGNAVAAINAALMLEQPNKASFHLMAIEESWLEAQNELAALREQVAALEIKNRALHDGLAFYADEDNYRLQTWDYGYIASEVQKDEGETARVIMIKAKKL